MESDETIKANDSRQESNRISSDNADVDASVLASAGVQYMHLDPTGYDYPQSASPWDVNNSTSPDPVLAALRAEKNFEYADIITVTQRYESFWGEHFHQNNTIRYIIDGSGYFDLRDVDDKWVRFSVKKGDFFLWPAGIYHRFTVDEGNFITAMRLLQGSPSWSSFVREDVKGDHSARIEYIDTYLCGDDPDQEDDGVCVKGVDPETSPSLTPGKFDSSLWPKMWRMESDETIKANDSRQESNRISSDNADVDASVLASAGVQYMHLDPTGYDYPQSASPWDVNNSTSPDPVLAALRAEKNFEYADIITVTQRYESFWGEHFHQNNTIRYIIDGSGYFDLRDVDDKWVRFSVKKGDFFLWPAGIYHRFTVDEGNFITAMRLLQGSPSWSSFVREDVKGDHSARIEYIDTYLCGDDPDYDSSDSGSPLRTNSPTITPQSGLKQTSVPTDTVDSRPDSAAGFLDVFGSMYSLLVVFCFNWLV